MLNTLRLEKKIDRTADLDYMPEGGFYKYKTNPNMTGKWLISGEMKVNRILTDEEVSRLNKEFGVADLPRIEPMDWGRFGFSVDGDKVVPKPKVKRQVTAWHGSPYDFEKFKTENIGTGEGAQAFGWGLYFTNLESIARNYAVALAPKEKYSFEGIDDIDNISTHPMTKAFLSDMLKSNPSSREDAINWVKNNSRGKSEKVILELMAFAEILNIDNSVSRNLYKVSLRRQNP